MEKIDKIMVALDFSENSEHAFNYAYTLAKNLNARLLLIHVVHEALDLRGFYLPHISFDKLDKEVEEGAKKMMERFCHARLRDFDNYESSVVIGIPYLEILKKAKAENVSMIVMGTQGLTGVAHLLFGSTAQTVLRNAKCPVLVVSLPQAV
jgi:nucleotide-binding universal stress UspA family protein